MAGRLQDKAAIITGGASGFGLGIAQCFVREGAKVLIADLNGKAGEDVASELRAAGHMAAFIKTDVSQAHDVRTMIARCVEEFGAVDCMVANAGLGQRPCALEDVQDEEFDRQFNVNVRGVYLCCKHVLPQFRKQGTGNIVITASGIALMPRPNLLFYGATKAAVVNFTKGLALELAAEGHRVNALCPAVGDTPMLVEFQGGELSQEATERFRSGLPMGRLIQPKDVGEAAVFLASDAEAGTITGCALPVDSGRCI